MSASQASSDIKTPCSNTGLNSQKVSTESVEWNLTVRVDWLQGTIRPVDSLQLERLVVAYEEITGDKVTWEYGKGSYMGKQWANQAGSTLGLRMWFNKPGENKDKFGHALISLSGSVLGRLKPEQVFSVAVMLNAYRFKATRFDPALDDYSKKITFGMILEAIEANNYARFQKAQVIKNYGDKLGGWTFNCGSLSSDRRLVIYNKAAESKGQIDSHRFEGRLRDKIAHQAYKDWISLPLEMHPQFLAGLVIGCVEFVDRGAEKNLDRMPELSWWKEFKDAVGASIRYSVQQLPTNMQKAKEWIGYQVAKTLQIIRQVKGDKNWANWLYTELDKVSQKFNAKDIAKLAKWGHDYREALKPKLKLQSQ